MTLRVNRRHGNAESYLEKLAVEGIAAKALDEYAVTLEEAVPVNRLPGFAEGLVSVQDFGAQQAAYLLNPKDGERILDACAAPGGKTGHILELADCRVTALDIDAGRLKRVEDNIARLGFQTASAACADARDLAAWYDGKPFDAILADVPCTASGVARRNPDVKWLRRPTDALKTARRQEALLDALWQVLKQGGRMLLATCSVFVEENDGQLQNSSTAMPMPNRSNRGCFYRTNTKMAFITRLFKSIKQWLVLLPILSVLPDAAAEGIAATRAEARITDGGRLSISSRFKPSCPTSSTGVAPGRTAQLYLKLAAFRPDNRFLSV